MERTRVVVACDDCSFEPTLETLRSARETLDEHRRETGHAVDWRIESLSGGVERAGAAAGVCGVHGSADPDSPLLAGVEATHGDVTDDGCRGGDGSDDESDLDRTSNDEHRAGDSR